MQDVIRTIVRERITEESVIRSRVPIKAVVRNAMAESTIVYKPVEGTATPKKPTFHYLAATPFNDRWTGLPPVIFDYFLIR